MKNQIFKLLASSMIPIILAGCSGAQSSSYPAASSAGSAPSSQESSTLINETSTVQSTAAPPQEEIQIPDEITTNGGTEISLSDLPYYTGSTDAPAVY